MKIKKLNNRGFSLLEILLAAIIFIITAGGIFITLNAIRIPVQNKENFMAANVFGKQVTQALYSNVNASTENSNLCSPSCTTFDLQIGLHQIPLSSNNIPATLAWPLSIITSNIVAGCGNGSNSDPCLVYTVSCGDGTQGISCTTNPNFNNLARVVNLQINYPSQ